MNRYIVTLNVRRQLFGTVRVLVEAESARDAETQAAEALTIEFVNTPNPALERHLDSPLFWLDESDPDVLDVHDTEEFDPAKVVGWTDIHLDCTGD